MHVHASEYLRNNGTLSGELANGNPGENEVGFCSEGGYGVLLVRRRLVPVSEDSKMTRKSYCRLRLLSRASYVTTKPRYPSRDIRYRHLPRPAGCDVEKFCRPCTFRRYMAVIRHYVV